MGLQKAIISEYSGNWYAFFLDLIALYEKEPSSEIKSIILEVWQKIKP